MACWLEEDVAILLFKLPTHPLTISTILYMLLSYHFVYKTMTILTFVCPGKMDSFGIPRVLPFENRLCPKRKQKDRRIVSILPAFFRCIFHDMFVFQGTTFPLPVGTFESMIFQTSRLVGYVIVPWRVSKTF